MNAIKSLGQHFLIHAEIAAEMVSRAKVCATDHVWEIGPGKGILTRELIQTHCTLKAFELDRRLAEPLQAEFGSSINLVMGDILKFSWDEELALETSPLKMVANIPYNITSPLLTLLEKHHRSFQSITLMVQKEVAQRICASPDCKAYGVMTLRLQRIFDTEILFYVGKESFDPIPEVDSAVLSLKPRAIPAEIPDLKKYLSVITQAFAHRRKTLRNNLGALADKAKLEQIQTQSGIDLNRRGETLSEAEFITLSQYL